MVSGFIALWFWFSCLLVTLDVGIQWLRFAYLGPPYTKGQTPILKAKNQFEMVVWRVLESFNSHAQCYVGLQCTRFASSASILKAENKCEMVVQLF